MEQAEEYKNKLANLKNAVESFRIALEIDISSQDVIIRNTLRSGQLQNFEFCVELMWKTAKSFLEVFDGIVTGSPKQAVKELVNAGYLDGSKFELLYKMINDRNLLSHIYNEGESEAIIKKLPEYYNIISYVLDLFEKKN